MALDPGMKSGTGGFTYADETVQKLLDQQRKRRILFNAGITLIWVLGISVGVGLAMLFRH